MTPEQKKAIEEVNRKIASKIAGMERLGIIQKDFIASHGRLPTSNEIKQGATEWRGGNFDAPNPIEQRHIDMAERYDPFNKSEKPPSPEPD